MTPELFADWVAAIFGSFAMIAASMTFCFGCCWIIVQTVRGNAK